MSFAFLEKRKTLKWTLGLLGAILIGALGSGVWQSLLAPALHASTRWVLNLVSLGLASYKNGIYQQVAADNPSVITLETLYWVGIMLALAIGLITGYIRGEMNGSGPSTQTLRRMQSALYALMLVMTFFVVNQLVILARLSYVNSADAHYHYVMRVATPYLDAQERAEAESDFAQIGSREDYVKVLSALESKCTAHGRSVTKFDPW